MLKKTFFFLIAGLVLLIAASNYLINETALNKELVAVVEEKVSKLSKGSLHIGELQTNLFFLKLSTKRLHFSHKNKSLDLDLEVPQFSVRLSMLGVLFGEVRLSDLVIESPTLKLNLQENEKKKPSFQESKGSPLEIPLQKNFINELSVNNLKIHISTKQGDKENSYKADSVELSLSSQRNKSIEGLLSFKNLQFLSNGKELFKSSHFITNLNLNKNLVSLKKILLQAENSSIGGGIEAVFIRNRKNGKIESLSAKSQLIANLDLSTLSKKLKIKKTKGMLQVTNLSEANYNLIHKKVSKVSSKGSIKSQKATVSNFNLLDSIISYSLDRRSVKLREVKLIDQGRHFASGVGNLYFDPSIPFHFKLDLKDSSLQDIFSIVNVDNDGIDLGLEAKSLSLKGQGKPLSIKISGPAKASNFRLLKVEKSPEQTGYSFCDLNVDIHIDKDHLNFGKNTNGLCHVKHENKKTARDTLKGDLSLKGVIKFKAETDLHFMSEKIPYELASTFLPVPLAGFGSIYTNIYSLNKKTTSSITFSGRKVKIQGIPVATAYGSLRFLDDQLFLNSVTAYADAGDLLARGVINFENKSFLIQAESKNLRKKSVALVRQHFFPEWPLHFSARSFHLDVTGDITKPLAANGSLSAELRRVTWGEDRVFDTLKAEITRDSKKIKLNQFLGLLNTYELSSRGEIKLTKKGFFKNKAFESFLIHSKDPFQFSYSLKPIELSYMRPVESKLPFLDELLEKAFIKPTHSFKGNLKGTADQYSLEQSGFLKEILYKNSLKLPVLSYQLNLDQNFLRLNFTQKGFALSGKLETNWSRKDWPFKAQFSFKQFDTRFLFPSIFYLDPRNFAYLTGDVELRGLSLQRKIKSAQITLSDFYLSYFHERSNDANYFEIKLDKSYSYTMKEKAKETEEISEDLILKNRYLDINFKNFETLLQQDGKLDIEGAIDLSLLSRIHSNIAFAKGFAEVKGNISLKDNAFNYEINLKNKQLDYKGDPLETFSFMIPDLEPQFENIIFDITYKNGIFHLKDFFAEKGDGSIRAGGSFIYNKPELKEDPLLFIEFHNTNFNLKTPYLKEISTNLSGKIFLKGNKEPYQLYGAIDIKQLNSNMNYNFTQEAIRSLQKRQIAQSLSKVTQSPFVYFDINLSANKTISINNNNLNLIASGDLRLLGSNKNINLSGLLKTESGSFRYKRDFTIDRCFVYFDQGDNLNPSIDIRATALIDNYTVGLNVLGRASSPLVDFDVNPKVSREDNLPISNLQIMYLISQGTLPESKDSPFTDNIITQNKNLIASLNYATEILPLEILDNLIGNDFIYFRPELNDLWGDGSIITLTTIINLRKNLDIKVRTSPSKLSRANLSLEYKFTPQIKTLFDFRVGDKENEVTRRNQSFNVKFNFPF